MSGRAELVEQGVGMSGAARYRLLAALYGTQFLALGFFYYGLAAVLRRNGVPLAQIGLLQLLAVFQVLRFAWAPVVDRYGYGRWGHYRGWLLVLHVLMVAAVLVLGPLDIVNDLPLVLTVVGAIGFLSATQDIAADATAVRLLTPAERGVGNGIQVAGSFGGFIIGGNAVLVIYDRLGWGAALALLAVLTAIPLPLLLRYREPPRAASQRVAVTPGAAIGFFRQPGAARWALVVMPLYYLGIACGYPLVTPMLVDAGWGLDRIGTVLLVGGGTVMIVGALAGGSVLGIVGRRTALVLFGSLQVAAAIALLPLTRPQPAVAVVLAAVALLHLAYAVTGTAIFTVSMDWTRSQSAGTDFTVQACFAQLCSHGAGAVSLALAGVLGYPVIAALSAILGLVGTAAVWAFQRRPASVPA
jgi:predicted MFS family arabinose efflux permease